MSRYISKKARIARRKQLSRYIYYTIVYIGLLAIVYRHIDVKMGNHNQRIISPLVEASETKAVMTVETVAAPTPTPAKRPLTADEAIAKYFSGVVDAEAITWAESGKDCTRISPKNKNGTVDRGLFQINEIHRAKYEGEDIFDCEVNARVAREIYDGWHGWTAWSAYNNGSYKQFLP